MRFLLPFLLTGFILSSHSSASGQWIPINNEITASSACCFSENFGVLLAGTNQGMYWSTNWGDSWHLSNYGINQPFEVISVGEDPNGIFISTTNAIYYSSDFGITWLRVWPSSTTPIPTHDFANINYTVFAATMGSGIVKTNNNGQNWSSSDTGIPTDYTSSIVYTGNRLIAGTVNEGIFISDNAGQSWQASNTGLPLPITIKALESDGTNLYAGSEAGLYVSSNNGASWLLVSNGPPTTEPINRIESVDNAVLVASEDIYLSTDTGATWSLFMDGIDTTCTFSVNGFLGTANYVYCGISDSCGASIYRVGRNQLVNAGVLSSAAARSIQVYPNPVPNDEPLSILNPTNEDAIVRMYDTHGRLVGEGNCWSRSKFMLDVSGISKGLYYLHSTTPLLLHTEKVVVN